MCIESCVGECMGGWANPVLLMNTLETVNRVCSIYCAFASSLFFLSPWKDNQLACLRGVTQTKFFNKI